VPCCVAMGVRDLILVLSDLRLVFSASDSSQRQWPEVKKEGGNNGELGGGVRWLSGWCDTVGGAPLRHGPVVVQAVVTGP
jgi:hypothetical protein